MSVKMITMSSITRLKNHHKTEIALNEKGNMENAYFEGPELREFKIQLHFNMQDRNSKSLEALER